MTYRFRKKTLFLCLVVVVLEYCSGEESGSFENVTSSIDFGDDKNEKSVSQQSSEMFMPDNTTMNSTYYSVENQDYDYEDFDLPILESETLRNLNFPHSLQAVQKAMTKISNKECINDTASILLAISKREKWALELLDSFPKFPESILYGNFYQLGNFDECIEAKSSVKTENDISKNTITGQYCLADIHFSRKLETKVRTKRSMENMALEKNRGLFEGNVIHWSICLPSSCGPKDAAILVNEIFFSSVKHFEIISVDVDPKNCETEKKLPITTSEIIYGSVLGIFLMFTLLATFIHVWHLKKIRRSAMYNVDELRQKQSSILKEAVICFSVINTTARFFHTKPNDLNLESICGVKFISMVTIIAGHSLIFFFGGPIANKKFFTEVSTRVEHAIFINSPIIVDTFLLLSGFLMCRLLLIELDKRKGKMNFLLLYIARYIRLTPAYAVVLGLYTTFLYRMGSGPFWESRIGVEKERCEKSWWLNLLYVNNYVGTDDLCMFQSWYLAVDYHLFIVAPFIIYPLWKKPRLGETILLFCTITSVVVPFWITYKGKLDPTVMAYPPEVSDLASNFYFVNYYIKTHMRISSYCIGLFYAYLVHKIQRSMIKLSTLVITIGWIFAIICGMASMFSIVIFYDPEHSVNIIENAMYASLHRVSWSLAIGWILLVCITDNAGFINKFLSHKFFIPASRLTYCAYLANGLVEIYSAGIVRQPMYMSIFELSCKTCGHIVLTFALAFVLCIFFESPIHGMEKILLKNFDVKKDKQRNSVLSVGEL
ncbi:unnamed protein product [Psylliodes chrysocephalus]|uniref:Nose resistant-to-fluoxetine protein N-terminal domain-containing protein n=1 Tax=Psylliodes chrysocephalus TaxID=3402493 RepID=A0A9P0GIJ4_9CUCU|nr:unnamed protein product [Psylliodes chrysocephala]